MSIRIALVLCGMVLGALPGLPAAAKSAPQRQMGRRQPAAQLPRATAPSSVVIHQRDPVSQVRTQPAAVIAAPDVTCPACTTAPEELLVPGGFAHASAYLLHSAAALQQLQLAADTTVRFTSVWPFGVQLRTSF